MEPGSRQGSEWERPRPSWCQGGLETGPQGTLSGAVTDGGEWCWYQAQPRLQAQLEHLLAMCMITFPCLRFPTVQVGVMLVPVTGCCEALGGMGWALPLALGGCL